MMISVIFPAYNEEPNIQTTMARALDTLRNLGDEFEIIIVDDRGQDRTGAIVDELAAAHPQIRVIHNARNLGQGASIVAGFREARGDWVLHNAMDYPFDLRDLERMKPWMPMADIVVAIRKQRAGYNLYRHILSRVNLALLHMLFPLRLRDYNFVQLYRREIWSAIEVKARGTAFLTPEALIRAHDLGHRITEIEIEYHPRLHGKATAGSWRVIRASLSDMVRFWIDRNLRRRKASPVPPGIAKSNSGSEVA